ncbi:hypothetical protein I3760_02G145600 [Carya illinoinensis]|nr:hypothetical protein I3760_02G145600 [Carya illinoinensis]
MDAHDKGLSSSMPTKASKFPKVSASDENDQPHQEMGSNIQNTQKFPPKHNMSQTISAAAKVAVPRKKIFAERNEAPEPFFSKTHVPKAPVFESKLNFVNPGTDVSDVPSPEGFASDDNEPNAYVANGSLRPYDPLTNFLSPRPKFLRYMPHRRREVFLRREKEIREGDELYINTAGSFEFGKGSDEEDDSIRGSLASSDEGSVQKEDEEIEDSDEDIEDSDEEIEEEKGRGLKRVLESLFCFVLLVLSTLYISSVSMAPSPSLQSLDDLKGECYNIQNHTSEEAFLAMRLESGTNIWDQVQEIQMGLDRGRRRANEERIQEEKMMEDLKTGRVKISEVLNEVVYGNGGESETLEVVEDEKKGAVDELRELAEPQSVDIDECREHETVKIAGVSSRMAKNSELKNGETTQNFEAFQDYQAPCTFDVRDHQIIEFDITNIFLEENDILMEPAEEVHNESDGDEEVNLDGMGKDKDFEILNLEAEGNLEEALRKHFETELLLQRAVIGISVFSTILASLVLGFHFKHKKTSGKDSSLIAKRCSESLRVEQEKTVGIYSSLIPKPSSESLRIGQSKTIKKGLVKPFVESVAAQKHCSVLPNGEGVHMERADSFVIHSSFHPVEESSKDDYESRAPTIELLGEFVVGEISSSLRSCGTKNRRIGREEGNYSVSTEKKSGSKVHSVSLQSQPTFPEFSSMDSHSCARYTTEKKVVKREEGGKDGEAKVITTTPVRRSSRIRNRSLTSP